MTPEWGRELPCTGLGAIGLNMYALNSCFKDENGDAATRVRVLTNYYSNYLRLISCLKA